MDDPPGMRAGVDGVRHFRFGNVEFRQFWFRHEFRLIFFRYGRQRRGTGLSQPVGRFGRDQRSWLGRHFVVQQHHAT